MYRIDEKEALRPGQKYLLVPAMLDDHFPLLKYALWSWEYRPVILENEEHIDDTGLKYVNNDMCYPCILNVGQMVEALKSGKYPLDQTCLLMPTVGDSCRGSNYISALRKGVEAAGFPQVPVVSMNLKGIEKGNCVPIHLSMAWRGLFAMLYGDLLMLLVNQTRPYEREPGAAEEIRRKWVDRLSKDLRSGRHMTIRAMKHNFGLIAEEFASLPQNGQKKQIIGLVGDIYTKYCHLGNWDVIRFLEEYNCEAYVGGLSWYVLYYIDTHKPDGDAVLERLCVPVYGLVGKAVLSLQKSMIRQLEQYGFHCLPDYKTQKREAEGYVSFGVCVGDGWLLGAEAVGMIKHLGRKVLAIHPFGCLPGHVCGKGWYPGMNRKLPEGRIVTVDVDSSGSRVSLYNRAKMLIDFPIKHGDQRR